MDADKNYLLCTKWGRQTIPLIKANCTECGCEVGFDAKNKQIVQQENMHPICIDCVSKYGPVDFGGGVVGGKMYKSLGESILEAWKVITAKHEKN